MLHYFIVYDSETRPIAVARGSLTQDGLIGQLEGKTRGSPQYDGWLRLADRELSEASLLEAVEHERAKWIERSQRQ